MAWGIALSGERDYEDLSGVGRMTASGRKRTLS